MMKAGVRHLTALERPGQFDLRHEYYDIVIFIIGQFLVSRPARGPRLSRAGG